MAFPFHVLILGSGSAVPNTFKNHTSQVVIYNNRHLLLDCGEGTQIRMKQYGVSMQKIDHIFISHLHGDHYLGLPGLISTMNLLGREKKLTVYGPEGIRDVIDLHFNLAKSRSGFPIEYVITQDKEMELLYEDNHVRVHSFPVKHKIPTTGFLVIAGSNRRKIIREAVEKYKVPKHLRTGISEGKDFIDEEGRLIENRLLTSDIQAFRKYAYCADTSYLPGLKEVLKGVNMMYHETSFLKVDEKRAKEHLHSTAEQAGKLARSCGVNKLLVGHISNKYAGSGQILEEARKEFPETYYAEEGKAYEID